MIAGGPVFVPSFWVCTFIPVFGVQEHEFLYPRSGFCTLIPVFGVQEHPPKPHFWKPPFGEP